MARYLRDINIHLGSIPDLPEPITQRDFNITTHTVQDLFLYMLPKRFELGNILKLNIAIKGKNSIPNEVTNHGGYVNYDYVGFDFENYFKTSKKEQNKIILDVLRDIITRIPENNKENQKIALAITDRISEQNFKHDFESKLSKYQRSKKYRAIVGIRVDDEGQNAYIKIESKSGNIILETHLLKNNVYEFYHNLYKSKWDGDTFKIIDRAGEIFKEFEI